MKISVVHPFYNHNEAIPEHIHNWNAWSPENKRNTEIIIVDDGSPDKINLSLFKEAKGLDIKVFQVLEDIKWNVTGARNLGITQATGEWLFPLDFDMSVLDITFDGFFKENPSKDTTYWPRLWFPSQHKPERMRHPHCNSFFIHKDAMLESGLYDEDFSGAWGWEDIFIHNFVFPKMGLKRKEMDHGYIRWYKRFICRTQQGEVVPKNPKDQTIDNYKRMIQKGKLVNNGTYKNGPILRFEWKRIL